MKPNDPLFLVVDLFCGAGGTTTGFVQAHLEGNKISKVIACVNHDPKAIKSHWLNYPDVKHFEEDIRILDLTELIALVAYYRQKYPRALLILWASLECTNFSKAKGGQPRDADSRTLADHLLRYIKALNPDYIQIENVVEFMSWGPLDEKGKPVSRKNGQDWLRWRRSICEFGYRDEWRELNSANYGAYTSRNRLFGVFAKPDLPIVFPDPTHAKNPSKQGMHGDLKKWKAVKEVLNFSDEGESIFTRKKALSDKTLDRIYAGLVKYVAKGDTAFISKYFSGRPKGKVNSVNDPASTVMTKDRFALVQPEYFIDQHYGNHGNPQNQSVEQPAGTILTNDKRRLVQCDQFSHRESQKVKVHCNCDHEWITTVVTYLQKPCPKCGEITSGYVTYLEQSEPVPFIMPTNYDNVPKSIEEPAPTITADRRWHYIANPSHGGHCTSTDAPSPVIIARQDKAPLYFVQVEQGPVSIAVYDTDSEAMIRIKQFMAVYGLVDIKMRMLRVPELLLIQGLQEKQGPEFQLYGTQADRKKFIGNSVVPIVVKVWIEAIGVRVKDCPTVIKFLAQRNQVAA
ncbi:MAG TPA: DNA cytosine methyltransferase [Chitinophagaceae bacterium]|nr:DNA cytosine methyltransferase [Chitinophagaceae bacterium]